MNKGDVIIERETGETGTLAGCGINPRNGAVFFTIDYAADAEGISVRRWVTFERFVRNFIAPSEPHHV